MIKKNEDGTIYEFSIPTRMRMATSTPNAEIVNALIDDIKEVSEVLNFLLEIENKKRAMRPENTRVIKVEKKGEKTDE